MIAASLVTPPTRSVGKRILYFPLTRIILGILATMLPVALTFGIVQAVVEKSMRIVWPYLLATALCIGAYLLYVRLMEKRSAQELSLAGAGKELGAGLLSGTLLLAVTMGALALAGAYSITGSNNNGTAVLIALAEPVMVGFFEEILFRGVIFRILEKSLGTRIALILSGVIFALSHAPNAGVTLLAIAITFVAGIMFTAAYMATRRLWLAIGIHIAWNFCLGDIFSVAVSGHPAKGLLQGQLSGPQWLTGGDYGVEGSIAALLTVTLASIYLLVRAGRREDYIRPFWAQKPVG
ncbi:CPBP family intramembrane glutamic endopeptidase [Undibacterium sp. TJN25]|uniref:CPBP family intramembrane glutamic endopeptidase n=1 Tax=Undibacterium sp. TJN25 TaxID=3413056 RepID=UPI003BF08FF0